eukprot:5433503-Prymnesium_polylepis.2
MVKIDCRSALASSWFASATPFERLNPCARGERRRRKDRARPAVRAPQLVEQLSSRIGRDEPEQLTTRLPAHILLVAYATRCTPGRGDCGKNSGFERTRRLIGVASRRRELVATGAQDSRRRAALQLGDRLRVECRQRLELAGDDVVDLAPALAESHPHVPVVREAADGRQQFRLVEARGQHHQRGRQRAAQVDGGRGRQRVARRRQQTHWLVHPAAE